MLSLSRLSALAGLLFAAILLAAPASAQYRDFPSPQGYWSFDRCDGSTTYDAAVSPHHATLSNGASCTTGQYGTAAVFDGSNDLVEVPGTTGMNYDRLTISAWVRPQDSSGWNNIANRWYIPDAWRLGLDNGQYTFSIAIPGGSWGTVKSVAAPAGYTQLNQWTHVAGTFDGTYVRIYINGTQRASLYAPSAQIQDSNRPVAIGSHPSWDAYQGRIDEVKLYDRALASADIQRLAQPPSSLGIRGLHLFPSTWVCPDGACSTPETAAFNRDLGRLHTIGNINSIKTSIFSMRHTGGSDAFWLDRQRAKLTSLKSAVGNHVTWTLRAWPTSSDCGPGNNYYSCGQQLAADLASTMYHVRHTLKLQNVFIEVANEPNISTETVFYDSNPYTTMSRYNDFFRGFYWGQRAYGYDFPLIYAGLSPECDSSGNCGADLWYQNVHVRTHIRDYAAKVGVHVYWDSLNPSAVNGRLSSQEAGGLYYRRVHDILSNPWLSPSVPTKGMPITEFNFNRETTGASHAQQATEFCNWWKTLASDIAIGYPAEQTSLYITEAESTEHINAYWLQNSQLDDVRNCQ